VLATFRPGGSSGLPHAAAPHQAAATCAACSSSFSSSASDVGSWSHRSSRHVGSHPRFATAASNCGQVRLEHIRGRLLLLTHAARRHRRSRFTAGAYLRTETVAGWPATRQHRQLDPDLSFSLGELSAAAAAQQCAPPWPPLGRNWVSLAGGLPGGTSGWHGLHQAQFRQLPAIDDVRRICVARIPPLPGGWPMAFMRRPMACATTKCFSERFLPWPGGRPRTAGWCPPARPVNIRSGPSIPNGWSFSNCRRLRGQPPVPLRRLAVDRSDPHTFQQVGPPGGPKSSAATT